MATLPQLITGGIFGPDGFQAPLQWTVPRNAQTTATNLVGQYGPTQTEVVRNPHRGGGWARDATRSPQLLEAVWAAIGSAVAVENTFLVLKWPAGKFLVPWHQDGIDRRIRLDPDRAVSAWLALSDATVDNGCLQVVPGSQALGYLPFENEPATGAERGRADRASGFDAECAIPVPLSAGSALLMDVRLLHRSLPNVAAGDVRVGLNIRYVAPGGIRTRDFSSPSLDPISGLGW